jgi:tetratricopeptide (TPR) repeat protein
MKPTLRERPPGRGNLGAARHAAPARTARVARWLFWLCVGGLVVACGVQTYDAQAPRSPRKSAELPAPSEPGPSQSQSGPSSDRALSESGLSATALADEELEIVRQLIRDYPNDGAPLQFSGNVYSQRGLYNEAVRYWKQSLQIEPNRSETYDAMADAALFRQEYERALELARKAVDLNPSLPSSRRRVAESLIGLGRLHDALDELHQALAAVPQDVGIHYLLGSALAQLGELDAAKKSFETAVEIEPRHAPACYQLFVINSRLNLPEQAEIYRERFVRLRSEKRDSSQKWVDEYDELQLNRRQLAETCDTAARYYRTHHNPNRAKDLWLRAAALDPHKATPRLQLAALFAEAGQTEMAMEYCEQAEASAPQDAMVHLNVGILAARLRRFKVAEAALRKACELAPENAAAPRLLCQVLLESNGNAAEAAALARKAVDHEPSAENYYVLGTAEIHRGNVPAAVAAVRRAVELAPNERRYRAVLEQLQPSR